MANKSIERVWFFSIIFATDAKICSNVFLGGCISFLSAAENTVFQQGKTKILSVVDECVDHPLRFLCWV